MPDNVPRVSVLLPCYNASNTLEKALQSLFQQTLADFEIVAVDDGSTDTTLQLLRDFAQRDPRLVVFSAPHAGIVSCLNRGLQACRSPLVARMDADDQAHPERLARQAAFQQAHPEVCLVSCRVRAFSDHGVRQGFQHYLAWQNSLLSNEDIRREIFIESPFAHPSVMFSRSWVMQVGGYQEHGWAEDYDLWLRLYLAGARFAKLPEVLLAWRDSPTRLTRTDNRYSLENFLRMKAHYLMEGPLVGRKEVIIWGAGMTGRRLSKHLLRLGAPIKVFVDVDPRKIGRTRRGLPILSPEALLRFWEKAEYPVLLTAVGARGARPRIRRKLQEGRFQEGQDWWFVA
jgi:glycosyltransferase involved in cell wall biosynthesis